MPDSPVQVNVPDSPVQVNVVDFHITEPCPQSFQAPALALSCCAFQVPTLALSCCTFTATALALTRTLARLGHGAMAILIVGVSHA